jgi:cell division septum initiation protein DivIVA
MSVTEEQQQRDALARENERLRARIAELEEELVEQAAQSAEAVAAAQTQAYWVERWRLDLDAIARNPLVVRVRWVVGVVRWANATARRLRERLAARRWR